MKLASSSGYSGPEPVAPGARSGLPVYATVQARQVELEAQTQRPAFSLMAQAGQSVAKLAMAFVPHARSAWVACGPGNNGGDGLVAARHLRRTGVDTRVTLLGDPGRMPADAARALVQARAEGVPISAEVVSDQPFDLMIDALLGLGQRREPEGPLSEALQRLSCRRRDDFLLAVDMPTGVCADTGRQLTPLAVHADATLSLLTLRPGLFMNQGRDHAGAIWLDTLGVKPQHPASASLIGPDQLATVRHDRRHAEHKGSYGDVWVIGGAPGMQGALCLAAQAALRAGAGRVYAVPLAGVDPGWAGIRPELMWRTPRDAQAALAREKLTVVHGCGGGDACALELPAILSGANRLILDADGLNALAADPMLSRQLRSRAERDLGTVLTPHPLEAARLLDCTVPQIQADRSEAARELAERFQCAVVLKGSGSVVAVPGGSPQINPSGNACLAVPGSGDVLAGWLGGTWSRLARNTPRTALSWHEVSQWVGAIVHLHGLAVESKPDEHAADGPMMAMMLMEAMHAALDKTMPGRHGRLTGDGSSPPSRRV